jgi:outer membrane receptor for monomeric catechols
VDHRSVFGSRARYETTFHALGRDALLSVGAGTRSDRGLVALFHQERRARLGARVDVDLAQDQLFAWAKQDVRLGGRLRLQAGLRADAFRQSVDDRLPGDPGAGAATDVWRSIVSPKLSAAFDVATATTLFASAGLGFHSNDARDAVMAGDSAVVLPRAKGAEVGGRRSWSGGSVSAALWLLDLGSELVYVGDEGVTEPSGRTRRTGIDVDVRIRLAPWLWADGDLSLARGRFRDEPSGANLVPLAPTLTSSGGLTVRDRDPVSGGVRYRHVGGRAADETGEVRARGHTIVEAFATWRVTRSADLVLALDNLLDAEWNEAQFATTSRLRSETAPVTELHFTPGAPRSVQLGVQFRF